MHARRSGSVQRVGEVAPARDHVGVGRVEQLEQLDQPGAHAGAVVVCGAPDQRDQPVEGRGDVLVEDLDVGRGERRVDVIGAASATATASGGTEVARSRKPIWRSAPLASAWFGSASRIDR